MTSPLVRSFHIALAALLAWALAVPIARACAPAPPLGYDVTIRGEEAIILWDAAAGIEHFIRRADFDTNAPGFGFIVPTPTAPELAEAPDALFSALAQRSAPEQLVRRVTDGVTLGCTLTMILSDSAPEASPSVQVLQHVQVAGYDAVVLAADDPQALVRWLAQHGYAHSEELVEWATPYVEHKWMFTAFKLATPKGEAGLSTAAVRMSFRADRPFYPYREPQGQREGSAAPGDRTLRVYLVADTRYAGELEGGATWPGEAVYARALPQGEVAAHLPGLAPSAGYLTVFLDRSNPRPGTADLYFAPAVDVSDLVPEPVVITVNNPVPIPLELVVMGLVVVGLVIRRRRRRRAGR